MKPLQTTLRRAALRAALLGTLCLAALTFSAGAFAATELTWYGQAAWKIVTPSGGVILIDPWISNPLSPDKDAWKALERVDYILVTHGHGDHVGNSVDIAKKTGAQLVTSYGLAFNMVSLMGFPKDQGTSATSGNVGGMIPLPKAGAKVTIVNAVHGSELTPGNMPAGMPSSISSGNPIGFVLQIDNGPTIYHTGDTDVFTDMKLIDEFFDVDVMLSTIGDHFTMGPTRAALAVEFVKPKTVIPMHFATFPLLTGRPQVFEQAIKARGLSTKMVELKPGESRTF